MVYLFCKVHRISVRVNVNLDSYHFSINRLKSNCFTSVWLSFHLNYNHLWIISNSWAIHLNSAIIDIMLPLLLLNFLLFTSKSLMLPLLRVLPVSMAELWRVTKGSRRSSPSTSITRAERKDSPAQSAHTGHTGVSSSYVLRQKEKTWT